MKSFNMGAPLLLACESTTTSGSDLTGRSELLHRGQGSPAWTDAVQRPVDGTPHTSVAARSSQSMTARLSESAGTSATRPRRGWSWVTLQPSGQRAAEVAEPPGHPGA